MDNILLTSVIEDFYKGNFKILRRVGRGGSSDVFQVMLKVKTLIIKVEPIFSENIEFECLSIMFDKLHDILPNHIIQPIAIKIFTKYELPAEIDTSYDSKIKYRVILMDKLGGRNLEEYLNTNGDNLKSKIIKEILHQLIIYLFFMKTKTSVIHDDLGVSNIVLKRNKQPIKIQFENDLHSWCIKLKPKYLAYPIDFGSSSYNNLNLQKNILDNDISMFWANFQRTLDLCTSNHKFIEIKEFMKNNHPYDDIKKLEHLIYNRFFEN
jgi:serine/threonine protein kinase